MIYVLVGLSLLLILIAFSVTEENAHYLLAGYNTLPPKEKKKLDLKSYLPFFRKFHLFLGGSLLVIGLLLMFLAGSNAAGIFMAVYPIAAYIYFIWKGQSFATGLSSKWSKVGAFMMGVVLAGLLVLMYFGFKEDRLQVMNERLKIEGMYGESLAMEEIAEVALLNDLPEFSLRVNGFALGNTYKGYFKTKEGEVVKLLLNSTEKPFLQIKPKTGKMIYYSSNVQAETALYEEIQQLKSQEKVGGENNR